MPRLDPDQLRAYARRDWTALDRLDRIARAKLTADERMRIASELYEAARALGWPEEASRAADLAHHLRMKALLDRAAHVGRQ